MSFSPPPKQVIDYIVANRDSIAADNAAHFASISHPTRAPVHGVFLEDLEARYDRLHRERFDNLLAEYRSGAERLNQKKDYDAFATLLHKHLREWVQALDTKGMAYKNLLNTVYFVRSFRIVPSPIPIKFVNRTLYVSKDVFFQFVWSLNDLLALMFLARNIEFCLIFMKRNESSIYETMYGTPYDAWLKKVVERFPDDVKPHAESWTDIVATELTRHYSPDAMTRIVARLFGISHTMGMFPSKADALSQLAMMFRVPSYLLLKKPEDAFFAATRSMKEYPLSTATWSLLAGKLSNSMELLPYMRISNAAHFRSYEAVIEVLSCMAYLEVLSRLIHNEVAAALPAEGSLGDIADHILRAFGFLSEDTEGDDDEFDDEDEEGRVQWSTDIDDVDDSGGGDDSEEGVPVGEGEEDLGGKEINKEYEVLFKDDSSLSYVLDDIRRRRDEVRDVKEAEMKELSGVADWVLSDTEDEEVEDDAAVSSLIKKMRSDSKKMGREELLEEGVEIISNDDKNLFSYEKEVTVMDIVEEDESSENALKYRNENALEETFNDTETFWRVSSAPNAERNSVLSRQRSRILSVGSSIISSSVTPTKIVGQTMCPSALTMADISRLAMGYETTYYDEEHFLAQEGFTVYMDVSGSMASLYVLVPELYRTIRPYAGDVYQFSMSLVRVSDAEAKKVYTTHGTTTDLVLKEALAKGQKKVIIITDLQDNLDSNLFSEFLQEIEELIVVMPFSNPTIERALEVARQVRVGRKVRTYKRPSSDWSRSADTPAIRVLAAGGIDLIEGRRQAPEPKRSLAENLKLVSGETGNLAEGWHNGIGKVPAYYLACFASSVVNLAEELDLDDGEEEDEDDYETSVDRFTIN